MGDISPISNPTPTPLNRFAPDRFEFTSSMLESSLVRGRSSSRESAGRNAESGSPSSRPSDQLDLSERARLIGRMKQLPPVRGDLVSQIRQQIQQGQYETSEKLDEAIVNLSSELDLWA